MNLPKPLHVTSCLFALVALLAAAAPSMAEPKDPKAAQNAEASAREHFQRGQRLSASGDYAGAYREFAAGYALTERPLFLFNMAEAARASGDLAKARENYLLFLNRDPKSALAATAQARIADIDRAASTATPPSSQGASGTGAAPAPASSGAPTPATPTGTPGSAPPGTPGSTPPGTPGSAAGTTAPPGPDKPPVRLVPPPVGTSPSVSMGNTTALPADRDSRGNGQSASMWKRPVFWVAVGGAAIAAVAVVYAVSRSDKPCSSGCTELNFR